MATLGWWMAAHSRFDGHSEPDALRFRLGHIFPEPPPVCNASELHKLSFTCECLRITRGLQACTYTISSCHGDRQLS